MKTFQELIKKVCIKKGGMMLFESWLENKEINIKKLTKKEGRELYRQFGQEMLPAVKDCANFLNTALKNAKKGK